MKWQGRNSDHHERIQNKLILLQHEHEWLLRLNAEREHIFKSARELHLTASAFREKPSPADENNWGKLQNAVFELDERLRVLDVAVYTGANDNWFPALKQYVEAVLKAVLEDRRFAEKYDVTDQTPTLSTRKALREANDQLRPAAIFVDLEAAIRMEFFDFKRTWDAELS